MITTPPSGTTQSIDVRCRETIRVVKRSGPRPSFTTRLITVIDINEAALALYAACPSAALRTLPC